ncbi:MAG: DUF2294 family protein [Chitinivibrionales bacterium]|nr:DUF2294 family protein [Chitinivibrionales bacterium]MBD3394133.1 DUF2294 family protein [Chitinivibrionales bacterium]
MPKPKFTTRGQMEAAVSDALTRFEKEYMGRGPLETKTYIVDDMVIARMKGILTKAEMDLVRANGSAKGRELIKQVRMELLESARGTLEASVRAITRRKIRSLHTDISTQTGEKIVVLILDKAPEVP